MTDRPLCRLYAITPPRIDDVEAFVAQFEAALSGGDIACLQVRLKAGDEIDEASTRAVTKALLPFARARNVPLIINDSPELCLELGADGVHLGATDMGIKAARKLLGPDAVIGATCKSSRHLAMEAGEAGADYVAFGAFYPTSTKADTTQADPEILSWWQDLMELPCVAIGGITVSNAAHLARMGADFVAVSSGIWSNPEGPAEAVAAFNRIFAEAAQA